MPAKRTMPRICERCGTDFLVRPDQVRRGWGRYCSKSCSGMPTTNQQSDPVSRFWSKVNKTDTCWLWTGAIVSGYGWFHGGCFTLEYRAHRVSWLIHFGSVPDGLWVLHHCDVPTCVRPDHLFLGDCAENVDDKVAKGRQIRGESVGGAKLGESDVRAIRRLRAAGTALTKIAAMYDVTWVNVWKICRRETWKHVD